MTTRHAEQRPARHLSAFPITPCSADGRVDAKGLEALLAPLVEAGVDSIGLLGSTGSYPYLTREERRRAVGIASAMVDGRVPLLVGVGALRTDEAVRLAQDARAQGAAMGLLAPVSYTPLTEDEVFLHFETVAGESGLPLCIYDNPSTTHFSFSPALIGRLSQLGGVVAIKCPGQEVQSVAAHLARLRAVVPSGFSIGYSGDWFSTEALLAGGDAWYSVLAGILPDPCVGIVRACTRGDATEARRLDSSLAPIWDLFRAHSSLRVVYAIANLLGRTDAQPPRPILPLRDDARDAVRRTLAGLRLL
jgi:4-hydroxy-tetrahydrodipicolinate synthase